MDMFGSDFARSFTSTPVVFFVRIFFLWFKTLVLNFACVFILVLCN